MADKVLECKEQCECKRKKRAQKVCGGLVAFVFLILLTILIIWIVLRPTKPRFSLQDASVLHFNLSQSSEPFTLSSTLQVTIATRNPNDRIGIFYDTLYIYAIYKAEQITLASAIQPYYQGHNDVSVWSPMLYGMAVPLSPYVCTSLSQDENAGIVLLHVRIDGRVRWKVGSWTSGRYHLHVTCPAFLTFVGNGYNPVIRFQQMTECSVDV